MHVLLRCAVVGAIALSGCSTSSGDPAPLVDTTPGVLPPVDANRPRGPVVVGPDLTPADYTCLGAAEPVGVPMPVAVQLRDWVDDHPHVGLDVRAASAGGWGTSPDCRVIPDCTEAVSDATGHAMMTLRGGRVWLSTSGGMSVDPTQASVPTWIVGLTVPDGATSLLVPVLSQGTLSRLSLQASWSTALGRVRDCAGAAVHRAHVRAFDALGRELPLSTPAMTGVSYANAAAIVVDDDRTTIDGVFVARFDLLEVSRIEAWGPRDLGGPEVLLGCETLELGAPARASLVDILPLSAHAPEICGSMP